MPPRRHPPSDLRAPTADAFLSLLGTCKPGVDRRLAAVFDDRAKRTHSYGPEVRAILRSTRNLCLRGGKRLRPGLVAVGHRAVTSANAPDVLCEAGTALELLQAYFLIHDDWMDGDVTRRGGPAVHAELGEKFGSVDRGNAGGILAGDYVAALATELIGKLRVPARRLSGIVTCFAAMQSDAVLGQELDVVAARPDMETTYRLKTASYTLRGPLVLGALIGGAKPDAVAALEAFADPIGIAFQLRDDVLNVFAPESATGKPFAGDIKTGKRTLLVQVAQKRGSAGERKALATAFGNPRATRAQLESAVQALESSGAKQQVEKRARGLVAGALEGLAQAQLRREGKLLLASAAIALTEREA